MEYKSYRIICVTIVMGKNICDMIVMSLSECERSVDNNQVSVRPGREYVDKMFPLNRGKNTKKEQRV